VNPLSLLQDWYSAHCNGDWEHHYGLSIESLDNPGWHLKIDLCGTKAEGRTLDWIEIERTEGDWIHYSVKNNKFDAAMGPQNLEEAIGIFLRWFETAD
jgi:hypothetical protein